MRTKYPVIEVFDSIQGEGAHSGLGATFIRLAGCNLRCEWCDTAHSFDMDKAEYLTAEEILAKYSFPQPMVIVTGGEPTLYDLGQLVSSLHNLSKYVSLETNGTNPVPEEWGIDWITVSPKPQSNYKINCSANELKYIVDDQFKLDYVEFDKYAGRVVLQVESCKAESITKAYRLIMDNPQYKLRLGVQLHKLIGVE